MPKMSTRYHDILNFFSEKKKRIIRVYNIGLSGASGSSLNSAVTSLLKLLSRMCDQKKFQQKDRNENKGREPKTGKCGI